MTALMILVVIAGINYSFLRINYSLVHIPPTRNRVEIMKLMRITYFYYYHPNGNKE